MSENPLKKDPPLPSKAISDSNTSGNLLSCLLPGVMGILLMASALGWAANEIRSSGSIHWSRNYFPKLQPVVKNPSEQTNGSEITAGQDLAADPAANGSDSDVTSPVAAPPDDGIQRLSFEEAQDNFVVGEEEYAATGESIYLFVDARVRDQYQEGHIPGAVWLYHYESESLIEELRPELEMAFFIIVYCNGGDCEDSLHLAADLMSLYGLPGENIYVYEGGLNEWREQGMPVTVGLERR
ncbi:MAG: rhodanese-like domain-containing protein [Planctomycetota bacterium]